MSLAPSRWCSVIGLFLALLVAGNSASLPANDPVTPQELSPDQLLLRGKYTQVPRGKDAHGKALWAYARYHLAPDKEMYDAAWEAHQKDEPLGTFLVMLCHQEGRAVRRDEKLMFELNFLLRTTLSPKKEPTAIELFILSQTNAADAKGVLDLKNVRSYAEFKKQEEDRCNDWLVQSADKGFAQARFELGKQYQRDRKFKEAVEQFDKAAKMGLGAGSRSKAFFLIEGLGIERDLEKAYATALEGAKAGDVFAMISTANYLYRGWGTKVDEDEARKWVDRAAATGHWGASSNGRRDGFAAPTGS